MNHRVVLLCQQEHISHIWPSRWPSEGRPRPERGHLLFPSSGFKVCSELSTVAVVSVKSRHLSRYCGCFGQVSRLVNKQHRSGAPTGSTVAIQTACDFAVDHRQGSSFTRADTLYDASNLMDTATQSLAPRGQGGEIELILGPMFSGKASSSQLGFTPCSPGETGTDVFARHTIDNRAFEKSEAAQGCCSTLFLGFLSGDLPGLGAQKPS